MSEILYYVMVSLAVLVVLVFAAGAFLLVQDKRRHR